MYAPGWTSASVRVEQASAHRRRTFAFDTLPTYHFMLDCIPLVTGKSVKQLIIRTIYV